MPRLKNPRTQPVVQELLDPEVAAPLAIPQAPSRHEHEHRIDPYRTLPGAMPDPSPHPVKRKRGRPRKDDADAMRRAEDRRRIERYDRYLDALISLQGDTDAALAVVYGIQVREAEERHNELLADVQNGVPSSSISEMLKRRDLDKAARVTILRKWAFCNNPAASLKALDILADLDEGGPQVGSYEQYVRLAMAE